MPRRKPKHPRKGQTANWVPGTTALRPDSIERLLHGSTLPDLAKPAPEESPGAIEAKGYINDKEHP